MEPILKKFAEKILKKIALFHAAAMLSPRRTKAFFFARLNSFSSFSLRGWTGKMFCVYAKQPLRDKSLLIKFSFFGFDSFSFFFCLYKMTNLEKMTLRVLKNLAKERNLRGYSKLRKAELIHF